MNAPIVPSPRDEYARRMTRVLNYIDQHLDEPLELAQLADVANFSRFHFHRVFHAWMGETLGDYARRRRLEKAAFRLSCGPTESVLETALATGFGSGEAFARAFKTRFGCTPSEWRRDTPRRLAAQALGRHSNPDQLLGNPDQAGPLPMSDDDVSNNIRENPTMEVVITDLPAVRVAYFRHIGPYGPGISVFWRTVVAPWMQSRGLEAPLCIGIGYDDPGMTPADNCRYDACVALPEDFTDTGSADIATLPGGRYARAAFTGQPAGIADAWTWLTRNWLPSSGLQCDDRPCLEIFRPDTAMDADTGAMRCDLCIPVRPL
ncbi:AraC family transcriptional regulator [Pseudoduganella chitinolytica]|uniref:AraC family transcriptional regulator n=1 Tax=Pseudoduganella chitinolytica TaxID=34070 RepID=A0ABY8BCT5_9BURK|nr:AraC family transcriptional regulator [Pseudoduganella chitinolytica]WEF32796.1 AraC family transcriptional regulator [Pseudoduganella chitinolytica]